MLKRILMAAAVFISCAPQVHAVTNSKGVVVLGNTLNIAKINYANETSLRRVDCDPTVAGQRNGPYLCASYRNPVLSDLDEQIVSNDIVSSVAFNPNETPTRSYMDSYSANGECYISSNFDHGIGSVIVNTPQGPMTVIEVAAALGAGPGVGDNPIYNDVQCGHGPANNAGDEDVGRCPGRVDLGGAGCGTVGPMWNLERAFPVQNTPNATYQAGDKIFVHWDSSFDFDDLQAMVATREIFDEFPDLNFTVVNGTKAHSNNGILPGSSDVMRMVFPDGLDAFNDRDNTLTTLANQIQETLESGGTAHIAEGGPSDFTADVIRELQSRDVVGLKRIRVVQHSIAANQAWTREDNLALVQNQATYVTIGNGNNSGNGTPDFNPNQSSEVTEQNEFISRSLSTEYSAAWTAAYSFVNISSRPVDFSDAVEVTSILGFSVDQLADTIDFADRFFTVSNVDIPTIPTSSERYAVVGDTLAEASALYQNSANVFGPRVDCDPLVPGQRSGPWICANFNNPTASDVDSVVVVDPEPTPIDPEPTPVVETDPTTGVTTPRGFAIVGNTLTEARNLFAQNTSLRRSDCDPLVPSQRSGPWICASYTNPVAADLGDVVPDNTNNGNNNQPTGTAILSMQAEDGIPLFDAGWSVENSLSGFTGSGYLVWRGANDFRADDANPPNGITAYDFVVTTPGIYQFTARVQARVGNGNAPSDEDNDGWVRFTSGGVVNGVQGDASKWTKFFISGPNEVWNNYTNGEQFNPTFFTPIRRTLGVGTHRVLIGGRSTRFAVDQVGLSLLNATNVPVANNSRIQNNPIPNDSRYSNGDLIVMEYDSCPDPDDIHAAVAGRMVLDYYGQIQGEDYLVVNGTCGEDLNRSNYIESSPQIFNRLYGTEGNSNTWSDAFNRYQASVDRVAGRMVLELSTGGTVWVAAGGPMDFTSDVIRAVQAANGALDTRNINVIQHSHGAGFNEQQTNDANQAFLVNNATYITIDNGNTGNNRTPDLNQQNATQVTRFRNSNVYGDDWQLAFQLFNPINRFDGSDTVEILWILGIESDEILNWSQFGNRFIP